MNVGSVEIYLKDSSFKHFKSLPKLNHHHHASLLKSSIKQVVCFGAWTKITTRSKKTKMILEMPKY